MVTPAMSVDEIVATIKHSSLPTVLVEGTTDANVYRTLEKRLAVGVGTMLPAGGRPNLLEVFQRRNEFQGNRCAFIADLDMWAFTTIPPEYADIIFTKGYSIENDVLSGPVPIRLMDDSERAEFNHLLEHLARWIAFEVGEWLSGGNCHLDTHVNQLVPSTSTSLCPHWQTKRGYREPSASVLETVQRSPHLLIRGKQVLQAFLRILSKKDRKAKYSKYSLLELCVTSPEHKECERILESVRKVLRHPRSTNGL